MRPALIAITEQLWRLLRASVNEADNCEHCAMMLLEDGIRSDPELASALSTLTSADDAEMGLLLWRVIVASRALRS